MRTDDILKFLPLVRLLAVCDPYLDVRHSFVQERVDLWKKKKELEQAAEEENESRRHLDVRERRARQRTSKERKRNEIYAINEICHRYSSLQLYRIRLSNQSSLSLLFELWPLAMRQQIRFPLLKTFWLRFQRNK